MGMPAVAVSLVGKDEKHYQTAAIVAAKFIQRLKLHPLPSDQIININVPNIAIDELKGIKVTRLGHRHKAETMRSSKDPWKRDIYWYGSLGEELDAGEGTDFHAVGEGYASITPLTIDMTAYKSMTKITEWISDFKI